MKAIKNYALPTIRGKNRFDLCHKRKFTEKPLDHLAANENNM